MSIHWTARARRRASIAGRTLRAVLRPYFDEDDADARRMRSELDAIRARFPDHA